MAIFTKKSTLEKIMDLLGDLSEEELTELKGVIVGEDEPEETDNVETTDETPSDEVVEEKVEEKEESDAPVDEPTEETPVEEPTEEPTETTEEAKEEVVEEAPAETPTEEPEPIPEDNDKFSQVEGKIKELTEAYNNLLAKVEPIIAKFEAIDNDTNGVGMAKPNSIAPDEEEGLSAYQWALKNAKY